MHFSYTRHAPTERGPAVLTRSEWKKTFRMVLSPATCNERNAHHPTCFRLQGGEAKLRECQPSPQCATGGVYARNPPLPSQHMTQPNVSNASKPSACNPCYTPNCVHVNSINVSVHVCECMYVRILARTEPMHNLKWGKWGRFREEEAESRRKWISEGGGQGRAKNSQRFYLPQDWWPSTTVRVFGRERRRGEAGGQKGGKKKPRKKGEKERKKVTCRQICAGSRNAKSTIELGAAGPEGWQETWATSNDPPLASKKGGPKAKGQGQQWWAACRTRYWRVQESF